MAAVLAPAASSILVPVPASPQDPTAGATPLALPAWLASALTASAQQGNAAAASAPATDAAFAAWAVQQFPAGPPASADAAELVTMHQVADARTPGGIKTAVWLAGDGDKQVWARYLAEWQRHVSPAQAAWGAQLLSRAEDVNKQVNDAAKGRFARKRPYVSDPTLETVVSRSNADSPSYPSGHTARAFLDATIMGFLMPEHREEFMALAREMAMGRIYGGVHYPTDTVGGAWEGAVVASWVIAHTPRPA